MSTHLSFRRFGALLTSERSAGVSRVNAAGSRSRRLKIESLEQRRLLFAGGPDAFGYIYMDSLEADGPDYDFVDISTTGTLVASGDDASSINSGISSPVLLGSPFEFYGNTYHFLVPSTNGYISTSPIDDGSDLTADTPLPAVPSDGGGARLYPLHEDLIADVYYEYNGLIGASIFQWDAQFFPASTAFDFQALLYDNGDILYQYGDDVPSVGFGSTTGIQDEVAFAGLEYLGTPPSSAISDLAILFEAPPVDLEPGEIWGLKFEDLNGDGQYQVDEPGLEGWNIQLIDVLTGDVVEEQLTAPNGEYWFADVWGGSYLIREVRPEGWTQTTPQPPPIFIDGNVVTSLDIPELAIGNYQSDVDYGDAPDNPLNPDDFPTLAASGGAAHVAVGNTLFLGAAVDVDVDGQPSLDATGDDTDPDGDDEDGVVFLDPLVPGTTARIDVTASEGGGVLSAWADFNRDYDWNDFAEQIFVNEPLAAGVNRLEFGVPDDFDDFGHLHLRFRLSTQEDLLPSGLAPDGEVEDYVREKKMADFGDAPDFGGLSQNYPTLRVSDGAAHAIAGGYVLGDFMPASAPMLWLGEGEVDPLTVYDDRPDPDEDGQPNNPPGIGGDDGDIIWGDDEDGVVFVGAFDSYLAPPDYGLVPGLINSMEVTVTHVAKGSGYLNAWIDFNGDDTWDAGEQVFNDLPLSDPTGTGTTYALDFMVPGDAMPGATHSRFRFDSGGDLEFTGLAFDGEVEDHEVAILTPIDFGDAPDDQEVHYDFPTTNSSPLFKDGARHVVVPGIYLGHRNDPEPDGQPNADATGDDVDLNFASLGDDEDGVRFLTPFIPGTTAQVEVKASVDGYLHVWFDWSGNGEWFDGPAFPSPESEHVFSLEPVTAGFNVLDVAVPAGAGIGMTHSRFRFTDRTIDEALEVTGLADNGEVEDYALQIMPADWGDAPAGYPVTIAEDGAAHVADELRMGTEIDTEQSGLHSAYADKDDTDQVPDDEDGVAFLFLNSPGMLLPGTLDSVSVDVLGASQHGAYLDAWIDFNGNQIWEADEQIIVSDPVIAGPNVTNGTNTFSFDVPATAVPGTTFARFRVSNQGDLAPTGLAFDGEVEDYKVIVDVPYDFGDAPEGGQPNDFPTMLVSASGLVGPSHVIDPEVYLGEYIDPELDGQPTALADGDDLDLEGDDEDGIVFVTPMTRGGVATIEVTASVDGYLNAWVDFNGDMVWNAMERIFLDEPLAAGVNTLSFPVPGWAVLDSVVSRFRYTSYDPQGSLDFHDTYSGPAADGEVEDHLVTVYKGDFGDAPDPTYPTLIASNGAVHAIYPDQSYPDLILGELIDGEMDGQPDPLDLAIGDDNSDLNDEDGVFFVTELMPGTIAGVDVLVGGTFPFSFGAFLDAWIDFNGDGDWLDPGEHVIDSDGISPNVLEGMNTAMTFPVPEDALVGSTYARFRLSSAGDLTPVGTAADGEVEDYMVEVVQPLDYGDAPDYPFPTFASNDGARHAIIDTAPYLGELVDADLDGQPTLLADGDDGDFQGDDEDGVTQLTPLVQGAYATLEITASGDGYLNAWIDFNGDGDWNDGEQIATDVFLTSGANELTFQVPFSPDFEWPLDVIGRFRITSSDTAGSLSYTGFAADGEVEDHLLTIYAADFGDAPQDLPPNNPYAQAGLPVRDYPTLLPEGAGHAIDMPFYPDVFLGLPVPSGPIGPDWESNGQPDAEALGDDLDTIFPPPYDDEDGVTFVAPVIPGGVATVEVIVTTNLPLLPPLLDAWIDFDNSGDWEPGERLQFIGYEGMTSIPVTAGLNVLSFEVPADAVATAGVGGTGLPTFSRWRISTLGELETTGLAFNGEVEDHAVEIETPLDWGDAPDRPEFAAAYYDTLSIHDGARHPIVPGFQLGEANDPELDGQIDIVAMGDDNDPIFGDDEDGVVFTTMLLPGAGTGSIPGAEAVVTASIPAGVSGYLDAWIDFHGDGSFADPPDHIAAKLPLVDGSNTILFTVPQDAPDVATFARFRLSSYEGVDPGVLLSWDGLAVDGEVEDHLVLVGENIDFGDAPDPSYPTLLVNNGASHLIVNNVHLGTALGGIDADLDGQPTAAADGDDLDGNNDDDGIVFVTKLEVGSTASIEATVQNVGYLNAWIDFNGDGDWDDPGEQVLTDELMNPTLNPTVLPLEVPTDAISGTTFARFRFSTLRGLSYDGPAPDGEVEDYMVEIPPPLRIEGVKWNDVNGNTIRDELVADPDLVFVIDVSDSSNGPFAGTPVGDVNGDGNADTILDAELQGFIDLNQGLIDEGFGDSAEVSIVVFGLDAAHVDMDQVAVGLQLATMPNTDANLNGIADVVDVLRLIRAGHLGVDGSGTSFEAPLQSVIDTFFILGTLPGDGTMVFLSDGFPNVAEVFTDEVAALRANAVTLRAYGAGADANLEELQKIDPNARIFTSSDQLLETISSLPETLIEPAIPDVEIYIDSNDNGNWDSGEPIETSDEDGLYSFGNLDPGTYVVREIVPAGFTQTFPVGGAGHSVEVGEGLPVPQCDFGNQIQGQPGLIIDDVAMLEGDLGESTTFVFDVTLSAATDVPVIVDFAAADGTATGADNDYLAAAGTLVFNLGDPLTKTVEVTAVGDDVSESDETFLVVLSNASNAIIVDDTGVGTIINDDGPVTTEQVAYTLVLTDDVGTELVRDLGGRYIVPLGANFVAEVYVDDLRDVGAAGGVLSAFADLLYDAADVIDWIDGTLAVAAGFPVLQDGVVDEANRLVDEAGGANLGAAPGADPEQLLFSVSGRVNPGAAEGSIVTLALDQADDAGNLTIVHGLTEAVTGTYESEQLLVVSLHPWQNPDNQYDVDANGVVDLLDVAAIVNDLNAGGPRLLPVPPVPPDVPPPYLDVDGNDGVSLADALAVVQYLESGSPLTLAAEPDAAPADVPVLTSEELDPLVDTAVGLWEAVAIDASQMEVFAEVDVRIGDLPGNILGMTHGLLVTIDVDAAGQGWSADPAPRQYERISAVDAAFSGDRVDLLTVVAHELGHVLGLGDLDGDLFESELMSESLAPGRRKLPSREALDWLFANEEEW